MPKTRASGEEIAEHFDSLPHGAGSAEARIAATARYFKIKPEAVHRHLKFWWPGQKYLKEFGGARSRIKWDRPTAVILKALNDEGSVARAAKVLQTTSVTLAKAIERHGIVQRWVAGDETEVGKRRRREHARDDGQEERVVS